MVKVKYVGDVTPCKIKVDGSASFWSGGEIKEMPDADAKKLTENSAFKIIGGKIKEETKVIESVDEEEVDFDLNDDGVVDDEDASIAGKVLASKRKKK